NAVTGHKPNHSSTRNLFRKIPGVPTSVCGNSDPDHQQQNSSHNHDRLKAADAAYSMLDTGSNANCLGIHGRGSRITPATLSDEIADAQLSIAVGRRAYRLASSRYRRGRAFPG